MRLIELNKGNLYFKDKIEGFLERTVTRFGNSAKADIPKRFIGRRAYILITEDESKKEDRRTRKRAKRD